MFQHEPEMSEDVKPRLDLVVHDQSDVEDDQEPHDFSSMVQSYFVSSKFSDITIRTKLQEFKVHRLVICGQSEYFSLLCNRNRVVDPPNQTSQVIQLMDDDPHAVEAMIHFMYGYRYDGSGRGRASPMLFHIKVYHVADKYGIPKLKQRAREKFKTMVQACWQTDEFPNAIAEAYTTTPQADRGLRDPLLEICQDHIDDLLRHDEFCQVLDEIVGFAADLVPCLARRNSANGETPKYKCPECSAQWRLERCTDHDLKYCPFCGSYRAKRCVSTSFSLVGNSSIPVEM